MRWGRDDIWTLQVGLPLGDFDFKFVVQLPNGSVGQWEPGANRSITVRQEMGIRLPLHGQGLRGRGVDRNVISRPKLQCNWNPAT